MHTEPHILELESVDSTNTYAKSHFDELPDGALVAAWEQTSGRGRLGRKWVSPHGKNLSVSLVMKNVENPFYATVVTSLAALELLGKTAPALEFFLKWPNDIYSGERKISGVLCEFTRGGEGTNGVIAGVGININLDRAELDAIDRPATSLKALTGLHYDVKKLLRELADSLIRYYIIYSRSPETVFAEWKRRNFVIGRRVEIEDASGAVTRVLVRDIAENGELVAERNGSTFRFSCGDVRITRESLDFRRLDGTGTDDSGNPLETE